MKLSKEQTINLHREEWDWCYHHPSKNKDDWPRWERNGGDIPRVANNCFLCEYTLNNYRHLDCKKCPLEWPAEHRLSKFSSWMDSLGSLEISGLYLKWVNAKYPKTRKKYAKLIRDLKER